jgi:Na+/pantothenate symporter
MTMQEVGFAYLNHRAARLHRRRTACAELVATLALVVSIVVVATVVSIGIARAAEIGAVDYDRRLAVAGLIAFFLAAVGGVTAVITRTR